MTDDPDDDRPDADRDDVLLADGPTAVIGLGDAVEDERPRNFYPILPSMRRELASPPDRPEMRAIPGIVNGLTVAGTCPPRGSLDELPGTCECPR